MSDVGPSYQNLQWKLGIESPSLKYASKTASNNILFAVRIPYPLLKIWYDLDQSSKSPPDTNSTSTSTHNIYHYVDLLECSIPGHSFGITQDESVRVKINDSLRKLASSVNAELRGLKGRKRKELQSRTKLFHILNGQTVSVEDLRKENKLIYDQLDEWKEAYENLELETRKLHQEMQQALKEKDRKISELSSENEELQKYIEKLQKSTIKYKGKDISEVQKKSRTLASFMSRAQVALWFAESFGLKLESMRVSEIKTGIIHDLSAENKRMNGHGFDDLPQEEKSKVEKVLFLLDKFCVGECFYHELSMVASELPRSYLIRQRKDQLNSICHISSTEGEGAQMPFRELLEQRIRQHVSSYPNAQCEGNCVKVKLSGDGAKMTRSCNFILMSFALLDSSQDVMAAKGNHTIAVARGNENYDTLKKCFKDVFSDVNKLVKEKKIEVDGKTINLEFFLGGDYKFLLILLGLSAANSNHACVWCKVHKNDRWNMSCNLEHYDSPELKRTLEELRKCAGKTTKNYCCIYPPLLDIELDHVVPDELHLLLRIMDVLIKNLIMDAVCWDEKDNWGKRSCDKEENHLNLLVETIKSCGVSFGVWKNKNEDGKVCGIYDFTSLMGDDKKKLLKHLPNKLQGILRPNCEEKVRNLWIQFSDIYDIVTCKLPSQEMVGNYFNKAREWVNMFLSLRQTCQGYKKVNVTPYMHLMVYHIPHFLKTYKSLKIFTGQGVEKNNDLARNIVLRKSNKWDSTKDILKHETRLWELRDQDREKRVYNKENMEYWERDLPEMRKNKRQRST